MENTDRDLIGKTKEEAEAILNEEGTRFRYDYIDGENQIHDCKIDIERVTLTLRDNKVVSTFREQEEHH